MEFVPKISDLPQPISPRLVKKEPRVEVGATIFKRFILVNELGRGRCSTSWLVEDPRFRRDVVLKLFRSANSEASDEERIIWRDFLRRLRILNHPDIVITMEFFHEGSWLALSSTYEPGPNLATVSFLNGKKLDLDRALSILKTVGSAIAAAHDKCLIVHGNLNAYNILVPSKRSSAKITDFGFHPPLSPAEDFENNPELAWKLACISPERRKGGAPSHADDIYAYAAIAFQLFTEKNPPLHPDGSLDKEAADALLASAPADWRRHLPIALSTSPQDRPQMLSTLLTDLHIYEEYEQGKIDIVDAQAQAKAAERAKTNQKKKPRTSQSPDNPRTQQTILFRLAIIFCIIAAPLAIAWVIYHNITTEHRLEAERFQAEQKEKAAEAEESAHVLELSDRLNNEFTPSKASIELTQKNMSAPPPTPKPTPLVPSTTAKDFLSEGLTKMTAGDPTGAMESYELAIVLQPDWPELLEARANAMLATQKADDAILEYSKALIIEPKRITSLFGRAKANLAAQKLNDAKADIQTILKIEPDNVEAKAFAEQNNLILRVEPGVIQ